MGVEDIYLKLKDITVAKTLKYGSVIANNNNDHNHTALRV